MPTTMLANSKLNLMQSAGATDARRRWQKEEWGDEQNTMHPIIGSMPYSKLNRRQCAEIPRLAPIPVAPGGQLRPTADSWHYQRHIESRARKVKYSVVIAAFCGEQRRLMAPSIFGARDIPALPSLTIVSQQLPWAITAHGSGRTLRWLTVSDVLDAVWRPLRLQVDEEGFRDWIMMQSGSHSPMPELKGGRSGEIMYQGGMTRLDLLGGKATFAGLVASGMGVIFGFWRQHSRIFLVILDDFKELASDSVYTTVPKRFFGQALTPGVQRLEEKPGCNSCLGHVVSLWSSVGSSVRASKN
ncbi:hypothetical protein C8R44DRAFT_729259 [Mycena epipterygia]|nr:hypothetical protein C8R44DRAFT_729259 [Mycena epipterygia]